jgi:hypothetical protein
MHTKPIAAAGTTTHSAAQQSHNRRHGNARSSDDRLPKASGRAGKRVWNTEAGTWQEGDARAVKICKLGLPVAAEPKTGLRRSVF